MKNWTVLLIAMIMFTACKTENRQLTPWEQGAFETGKYRNLFAELGYPQQEIDQKLSEIFESLFTGPIGSILRWKIPWLTFPMLRITMYVPKVCLTE